MAGVVGQIGTQVKLMRHKGHAWDRALLFPFVKYH
jgi:hypothetical protein